ncbi:MAG: hypothetical protein L6Q54_05030 [Leptospiraceae bacterium]|nr:hypothetical protein [Leptospiraceae bacterium]MCK6380600.1 hypothetical protein [Leptospiraceae bacterium]NUM42116.1 hypothetical protein [Leptospiraceae bacterium]
MQNDSLNIPVKDFLQKLKLFSFGFLTPIIILFILYFGSPLFLIGGTEWKKSETLILEIRSPVSEKQIQIAADILKKKRAENMLIIFDESFLSNHSIGMSANYISDVQSAIVKAGILEDKFFLLKINSSKLPPTTNTIQETAKYLLKTSVKSVIIQAGEFESNRVYLSYRSVLHPLGIQVSVYPEKGKYTSTNWFSSEEGIELVTKELVKYIYYTIRGNHHVFRK